MASSLSFLGTIHTAISVVPVVAGAYGFVRAGRIEPHSRIGDWYLYGMLGSVFSAFGLSSTGGFNSGHALGIIALAAIFFGRHVMAVQRLGNARDYLQTASMTFSYLVLMIPGLNESLSRLPVGNPIGHGPDSPEVKLAIGIAFGIFVLGLAYQLLRLRGQRAGALPV
ncbi:hypothetical protein [Pseudomonas turukhanskensis]|uniref:DUF2306 domain-containing protein n=1 Tax=Pseudomonas turukhanskensis TaxID=1806536 RepID=A0A9W6K3V1_9PSED|nr:hypothetical protein [Pseudomonas turukhanskensis]GLK88996.1 hypothetical protein GCM10017655_20580 [Pseudomonas turukhanskensis]